MGILCSEVAKRDAEKESEARCKAILNKLISEVKKQTLEMEGLAERMNELAVGFKAIIQPLGATVQALPPSATTPTPTLVVAVDHAVAAATPCVEAAFAPESPPKCSMIRVGEDTASRTSAFMPDVAPGPPSTAVQLDVVITSIELIVDALLVRDGTRVLTSTPSGAAVHSIDLGDEHIPNLSSCQLSARKLFDEMPSRSTVVLWPPPVKWDERQLWPPPSRVVIKCSGEELRPTPWPSLIYCRAGVQHKQPWPPPGSLINQEVLSPKLLGKDSTDIDIALDNMMGRNFCEKVNEYSELMVEEQKGIGVIQCNPDQSKHLETARMLIFDIWINFVNLRSEKYAENSHIPTMEIGTVEEDAYRRDLTINSLFFNINTNSVEDLTGRGLEDLKKGLIVTPLPAKATFLDDPLSVLRAIRFAARFNFTLAENLKEAASNEKVKSELGSKISRERIGHKVDLMVLDKHPVTAMCYNRELGLFYIVFTFPEKPDPPVPPVLDKCDWLCVSHIEVAWNLAHSIGCSVFSGGSDSKSQNEQRRLCLYSSHVTLECALPSHPNMVILGDSWPPRKQLLLNLKSDDSAQSSQIETISQGRENFVKEIDSAVADVVMAIVADFMFVYLPAPTISLQPPLAMNAEHIASFFHNCPNDAFQIALTGRSYSLLQKLGAILRNGAKLFAVGTSASLIGTGVTIALIKARKAVDTELDDKIVDIPIVSTSVVYGIYMAVSSNLRYQVLASVIEQRMLECLLQNHKLLLEHFAYMVDILGMEKKLLVVRVWQFGVICGKYRLQTVPMRVRQKLKASDQVQWLHFRMLMQQKHGGDGLFREVFSIGYSVVFRCALMGNKQEAVKTETQLLRVFHYAWNKLQNGACRREEILLQLEQGALGHGSSLLSRVQHFKQKMLGEKVGIKISRSGSIHISSGIMENMLPRVRAFVGFRPQLVNSGDNVVEAIDIHWKNTSEGNTCGSKQAHGRRSEGYKVKKINVIKRRTMPIRDSNSIGGVILQDGSCVERPVQGRKRCELHKGRRVTGNPKLSFSSYTREVEIPIVESIPRLTENASKSDQAHQIVVILSENLPTTVKESSRQGNSFEAKEVKTGEAPTEDGTYETSGDADTCRAKMSDSSVCNDKVMLGSKRCQLHDGWKEAQFFSIGLGVSRNLRREECHVLTNGLYRL